MFKIGMLALTLTVSANLFAKDSNGSFAIKGIGTFPCTAFIGAAAKDTPELQQYAGYLAGYVSAFNEIQGDTFDLLPWQQLDTVMLLVLQRCQQTPEASVAGVVSQVAQYFAKDRLKTAQQKVEVKGPDTSISLFPSVVEQITVALQKQGYDTSDLWSAMRQYQEDKLLVGEHPFEQLILLKLLYGGE